MEKKEIKIFRAGRESLEEAVRLVQSTEEKMKEKSWFVSNLYSLMMNILF